MRKIKFRAWNKQTKNIYRCTSIYDDGSCRIQDDSTNKHIEANNVILLQYTGLKDKNGVEIYEGDIVKEPYYVDENNGFLILKVIFKEGEYLGEILNKKGFGLQRLTIYKEVIGNIYENHELLNNN